MLFLKKEKLGYSPSFPFYAIFAPNHKNEAIRKTFKIVKIKPNIGMVFFSFNVRKQKTAIIIEQIVPRPINARITGVTDSEVTLAIGSNRNIAAVTNRLDIKNK